MLKQPDNQKLTRWTNSNALSGGFHQVLVYGAGVQGSLYAARLRQAGVDITLLARGRRLADLWEHGIVLESLATRELTVVRIPLVEFLLPDDHYDLVLVLVRRNQVDAILPALAAARGVTVLCFMVNTADGFEKMGPGSRHLQYDRSFGVFLPYIFDITPPEPATDPMPGPKARREDRRVSAHLVR
jgi:hypothetical protein